jgi:hypothetical protein
MLAPSIPRASEALALALTLPAVAFGLFSLNPLVIVAIAGVSLIHAAVLGIPLFIVLRKRGLVNVATSTIGGTVIGALPAAILFREIPGQWMPFAAFGAASGFVFGGYIWMRGSP